MAAPAELINLSQALTEMLVKGRADYERIVRALRWGEWPVWAVGSARSLPAAETLRCAFQDFLGQPLIVRESSSFLDGTVAMLRPGSVVVMFDDEAAPLQDAARAARRRGAQVLIVSSAPVLSVEDSPPALSLPSSGAGAGSLAMACLQHAAAAQLGLVCARQLARPQARIERWERDWRDLPTHLDRLLDQLSDGVAALGRELQSLAPILLVGGGYYSASAQAASALSRDQARRTIVSLDFHTFDSSWLHVLNGQSAVVLLVGSDGRAAKAAVELAAEVKQRGSPLYLLAPGNHQDLIRQARLSLILPEVGDLTGSILALALAGWIASRLGGQHPRAPRPPR